MKHLKKILSVILACSMVLTFMYGCTKKTDTTSSVELGGGDGPFIPEKDLKISVWVTQGSEYVGPPQAKKNLVDQWLVNKTRVSVDNAYGNGGGQWEAVLARLIAGDNFPDLVACGGGQGPAHFAKLEESKSIWELTPEILQTYAPDVWEKTPQEMWERIKVDGKIYGIPYSFPVDREIDPEISDMELEVWGSGTPSNIGTSLWIRDDILKMFYPDALSYDDAVALLEEKGAPIGDELCDVPIKTTDDLVNLMRGIKDLNLKEGQRPVHAFGYAGEDCWVPLARLGPDMMGYVGYNYISAWDQINEKIIIPLVEPLIKETALLQNQLLREKVIDPESLVHTDAQCKEKILNGQYAIAVLSAVDHPPFINEALAKAGKSYRYRPLYTQIQPQPGYSSSKEPVSWYNSVGILKKVTAEDLPQILNWINTQFTDEWEEVRYWGSKDDGLYEDMPDGTRKFKDDELNKKFIYKTPTSLGNEDCFGLNDCNGLFNIKFKVQSKWDPMMYNQVTSYVMVPENGGKLSVDSPYKVDPIIAPPSAVWAAEYAGLDSVTKFWSTRSQWENPFKLTLAAQSDEEFNRKWQAAVDNLKSLVDIDEMAKEMTDIAKTLTFE